MEYDSKGNPLYLCGVCGCDRVDVCSACIYVRGGDSENARAARAAIAFGTVFGDGSVIGPRRTRIDTKVFEGGG